LSVTWSQGAGVNRYFADEALPGREMAALKAFARRDPVTWTSLVLNAAVLTAVLLWFVDHSPAWHGPTSARDLAALGLAAFCVFCAVSWLWWELSLAGQVRRAVGNKARTGSLLTSSFGPRTLRVTTPDISYEIPYTSIARVVRFGDVLLVKPTHQVVLALPMELVTGQDYELIMSKVRHRPAWKARCS
jgi:hypothetical protein